MASRRVFGRVKAEVGHGAAPVRVVLELTRAGLTVRRKGARKDKASLLPPSILAQAASRGCSPFEWRSQSGEVLLFELVDGGLEVRRSGFRSRTLLAFAELANMARKQPELLAVDASAKEKKSVDLFPQLSYYPGNARERPRSGNRNATHDNDDSDSSKAPVPGLLPL